MKKKLNNKHDHKLTHVLKVFIYMCVMLAPFLAIASKVWYTASNKNAYESYTGNYNYATNVIVTDVTQYKLDTLYRPVTNVELTLRDTLTPGYKYKYLMYDCLTTDNQSQTFNSENYNYDYYYIQNNGYLYGHKTINDTTTALKTFLFNYKIINLELELYDVDNTSTLPLNVLTYYAFVNDTTLSSVFYSAIDELDKASIFSWTTDTELYPAINNMCMMLGISSPPLAVLLTYWMLITIIYVIIDIVIEMIIWLTHLANDQLL